MTPLTRPMMKAKTMEFIKYKIAITGCAGFIFSHVTDYYIRKGWNVVGIDDLTTGSHPELLEKWALHDNFVFHKMDVSDINVQDLIIREEPDYIIHASAISAVDFSIQDPEYTLKQNILSTINVFEAARHLPNMKKLLYVSTDEVYGECEEKKTEDAIIFPKNPYAISKAVGSLMRLGYDNTYLTIKDKTCETRFCNVFGDRQDDRKVLSRIKKGLEEDSLIPVQNGGKGYREYIYIKNIPPVVDLILQKGDRTYNVTLNDGFTVEELIKKAEVATGKVARTTEAHRPGMDMKYQMDNTRLKELGWTPLFTFEEGLIDYLC